MTAILLAHPNMSAAQAIQVCRTNGLLLVHTKRGNFIYESTATPSYSDAPAFPAAPEKGVVGGPYLGAA